jgi:hypothetical protein
MHKQSGSVAVYVALCNPFVAGSAIATSFAMLDESRTAILSLHPCLRYRIQRVAIIEASIECVSRERTHSEREARPGLHRWIRPRLRNWCYL